MIAGTINCGGMLRIKALRVGKDTTLSQIVKLVESAQVRAAVPAGRPFLRWFSCLASTCPLLQSCPICPQAHSARHIV